ncbi:MAG: hypothetical protein IPI93_10030 [Sphingobacteriaceae bacterium]|nr:hypothetical protein [Sphingobacteriaceae bacterium]
MIKKIYSIVFLVVFTSALCAQITYGKVTYERKTNLYKRLKHWEDVKEWVKESEKVKVDEFELTFTDSLSCFKPVESEYRDNFEWATSSIPLTKIKQVIRR